MRCIYCNKPVKKWTTIVYVRKEPSQYDHPSDAMRYAYVGDNPPRSIADCRRLSNQQVVSVSYETVRENDEPPPRVISMFHEWDGEHYMPTARYFCSGTCAMKFARAAADAGYRIKSKTPEKETT